jgi:hypothetical protein
MKRTGWRVIIISLLVLAGILLAFGVAVLRLGPIGYRHACQWWEEKTEATTEEWQARRLAHLRKMEQPKLSGKEVAALLREQKGIYTQELYDMADWYVYHGDADVIRQVLVNRQYEMKTTLPEESGGPFVSTDYTIYDGHNGPYWNTDAEILIHHQELHRYAANKDSDPHSIYYVLGHCRWFNSEDYNLYYGQLLFYDDILAYLRVYANYKEWPTIRSMCERGITEYPCVWRDLSTIEEVLKIADEKGAEPAHRLYMQRYSDNYQKQIGNIRDHKDRAKIYEYESTFRGWSSENIRGETRVYKVDSEDAVIGIRNVERILLVLRDGEDITELCGLTAENVMTIPLKAAETVELEYRIGVTPVWWKDYMERNTGRDFQGPPRRQ